MTKCCMPDERDAITHKFNIDQYKGYITCGKRSDGTLGEIFIRMNLAIAKIHLKPPKPPKELMNSDEFACYYSDLCESYAALEEKLRDLHGFMHGMTNAFSIAVSTGLKYGVPIESFVDKFCATRFPPSGFTKHKDIRVATSLIDYLFRYIKLKFLPETE